MSEAVTLTLRARLDAPIEVTGITADNVAALGEREIADLAVFHGRHRARVGDFFDVRGERSAMLRVVGDLSRVDGLGEAMTGGEMIVEGHAGGRVGARMAGGTIFVDGDAGDEAGVSMSGGLLRVRGSAGHRVGAAAPGASKGMTGGEIIVHGSVRTDAASRMRRGLVVVGVDAGEHSGRAMIAGTLIVFGRTGPHAGRENKRGSIVSIGGIDVPATYRYACTYTPPHLRFTLTYLRRHHRVPIDERVIGGYYRRYCGDAGEPGKGEILELVTG